MRRKSLTIIISVTVSVAFLLACTNCTTKVDRGATNKNAGQTCAQGEESPVTSTGTGALIVTDISGSMKGFAQPGSVRLFSLHDALEKSVRNAIAGGENSPAIRRCYLGEGLDCNAQISKQGMDNQDTYSATESRLDLFLKSVNNKKEGDAKGQEDPLDPYRLAVLLTDGMQARASDSSETSPCLGGADPDCLAHLLKQRVNNGYGVWMALLLLPFKGTHFAERPLDNSLWQRVQQHTATLAQDPYFQGVSFNVSRAGTGTPFKSYTFNGVKPLLVLVLSKDRQVGRSFLQQFTEAVRREGIVQPGNAVYAMELAPITPQPRQISKVSLASQSPVQGVRPVAQKRQNGVYDYLVECDLNGSATLVINWEDKPGAPSVPEGIGVEYKLVPTNEGNFPAGRLSTGKITDKGIEVQLNCQQIKEGAYEAWFKLEADMSSDTSASAFWGALHANNMYEAPERLYGLKDLVQSVLQAVTQQPRPMDCIRFRIERK